MLLLTVRHPTNIVLDFVLDTALRVVGLDDIDLTDLSEQRSVVRPLIWLIIWAVEADEVDIGSILAARHQHAEAVMKVWPDPASFGVEVCESLSIVVLGMIDDLHLRIEVYRTSILRPRRLKAVKPYGVEPFGEQRASLEVVF